MYGITGVFNDPDDEGCGVLEFKQGFNGHAEELVGAFILPTSTIRYKLVEAVHAIKPLKKPAKQKMVVDFLPTLKPGFYGAIRLTSSPR